MLSVVVERARPARSEDTRGVAAAPPARGTGGTAHSCSNCCLRNVCLPGGMESSELAALDSLTTGKRRVARGAALYRGGDAFDALFAVRSGSFKNVGVSTRGEEKITGFFLPGELMGLDAINGGRHQFSGIALEDSEVCVVPFSELQAAACRIPSLQGHLFRLVSRDISRDEGLMLLLGSMNAGQRLAAFLLSLSRRYHGIGYAANRFNLRMTREDIGSYLGLTLETVSRLLSRFQHDGLIRVNQREVEIRRADALLEIVGCW